MEAQSASNIYFTCNLWRYEKIWNTNFLDFSFPLCLWGVVGGLACCFQVCACEELHALFSKGFKDEGHLDGDKCHFIEQIKHRGNGGDPQALLVIVCLELYRNIYLIEILIITSALSFQIIWTPHSYAVVKVWIISGYYKCDTAILKYLY